jgi:hypothetical protein
VPAWKRTTAAAAWPLYTHCWQRCARRSPGAAPAEGGAGKRLRRRQCCGGICRNGAAAAARSTEDEDSSWFSEPFDIPCAIHERAQMAESEHGAGSYAAYVQGLPTALEQVLGHAELGPRLQQQAVSHMVGTVLTNYTISFDQAARALRGDAEADSDDSLLNLYSKAAETAFWSMLMSLLVLVVMVVVFIRMERHLRVISERAVR